MYYVNHCLLNYCQFMLSKKFRYTHQMVNMNKTTTARWLIAFICLPILISCKSTGTANSTASIDWKPLPVQCTDGAYGEPHKDGKNRLSPIVRIEPKYPMSAMRRGITGCTRMMFDLTPSGKVTNIRIIESWPKRVFEASSIQALKRWVYQPVKSDNTVDLKDMTLQLDFMVAR